MNNFNCSTTGINIEEYKKVFGKELDSSEMSEYLTHVFFDAPIYATAEINDEELFLPCDSSYVYDKEESIKFILEEYKKDKSIDLKVLAQELENTLPTELKYN